MSNEIKTPANYAADLLNTIQRNVQQFTGKRLNSTEAIGTAQVQALSAIASALLAIADEMGKARRGERT